MVIVAWQSVATGEMYARWVGGRIEIVTQYPPATGVLSQACHPVA